ncbi:MAG: hypothetical protein ACLR78_00390 [Roseburia sp.]
MLYPDLGNHADAIWRWNGMAKKAQKEYFAVALSLYLCVFDRQIQ